MSRSTMLSRDDCVNPNPDNTLTDRLNTALNSSGPGYVLSLCPNTEYIILAPIHFAFPGQEMSTLGYPTGEARAVLTVQGPVRNGTGHTTAVDGTCANCDGVRLRNIQVNGTRKGASPTTGGANIEMGGSNANQLIEYVHSFDPRSWSCLHVAEGSLSCTNVTVQNNDIGPCGSDMSKQWADGISFSCRNGVVRNNLLNNPTDGGIVLFGSPGTLVENNTIWVENRTMLGGINMVDHEPFNGDYTGVIVRDNLIMGGFATNPPTTEDGYLGYNKYNVMIKIGIAIGPRTWFGDEFGANVSMSGTVENNELSGAFGYGIAISSARNFTIQKNFLTRNTAFIGSPGPKCNPKDTTPSPMPFLVDQSLVNGSSLQVDFQPVADGNALTCIIPPQSGDQWPYSNGTTTPPTGNSGQLPVGSRALLIVGVILGVLAAMGATWFVVKWRRRKGTRSPSSSHLK
ncbi:hypothetical protein BD410DRAFT_779798 [Rickenella mellea]|uniref:Right handed beta helix domain-containing protein n=1 Tax=Rickenella mellea TaxID=50990 RepID=A0A4V3AZJ6_9AGAM|nr:hypothetical protein BD410DRAFT_779798 [Rickenella mellea]